MGRPGRLQPLVCGIGHFHIDAAELRHTVGKGWSWRIHIFKRVCLENGTEQRRRLTGPCHPWTNGQAGRMVRTIGEAAVSP